MRLTNNIYYVNFEFSTSEEARITIYFCANQGVDSEGKPTHFAIPSELPSASINVVDKGSNQVFADQFDVIFDVSKYENAPLFNSTRTYTPWTITIEPTAEPVANEDGISDYQNLITYCNFNIDKGSNILDLDANKQTLIAFDTGFALHAIYGIGDALAKEEEGIPVDDMDPAQQCVICISDEKNCIVMPWGHLWLCRDCSQSLAAQPKPQCPICRESVTTFLPINIDSIKSMEEKTKTNRTKSIRVSKSKPRHDDDESEQDATPSSSSESYDEGYDPNDSD